MLKQIKNISLIIFSISGIVFFSQNIIENNTTTKTDNSLIKNINKVNYLLKDNHLNGLKSLDKNFEYNILNYYLSSFDEYSRIEQKENFLESETKYRGLGVEVSIENNNIKIHRIFPESPLYNTNIKKGMIIHSINGEEVKDDFNKINFKNNEIENVDITFLNENKFIEKENIPIKNIKATYNYIEKLTVKDKNILVYNTSIFSTDFKDKFIKGIKNKNDIDYLFIDLRDNLGGSLEETLEFLSLFLDKDNNMKLIIKKRNQVFEESIIGSEKFTNIPLYVVVNENSASASEIFSGFIKDSNRGKVIGTKTFGKGVGQLTFDFDPEHYLIITNFEYFINNKKINKKGIKPDIKIENINDLTIEEIIENTI
tara:strand:+ start:6453 stop:7562 length:1110 start_codon:yes stop_codon:yes gene_type:complete